MSGRRCKALRREFRRGRGRVPFKAGAMVFSEWRRVKKAYLFPWRTVAPLLPYARKAAVP